jgi:hypothetical protein
VSKYNLISVDAIMSKLYRDLKPVADLNEYDVIEYIGEALEAIGAHAQYEHDFCFIDIKNHRGDLPNGLVEIVQLAYSNQPVEQSQCIKDSSEQDCDNVCDTTEQPECWSAHNKYYIPEQRYLDAIYEQDLRWMYSPYYYQNFIPMRLSTNTFKGAVGSNDFGIYVNNLPEYHISNGQVVITPQEGVVAISYVRMPVDENGFPMIPDLIEYKEAITRYVAYKAMYPRLFANEPNIQNIYERLERDWHWYCKQARNSMMMNTTIDEKENFKDISNRMLPIKKGYYGFFGNINTPEQFKTNGRRYRF